MSYRSLKTLYQKPKPLQWYVSAPLPIFALLAIILVLTVAPRAMQNLVKENAVDTAVDLTKTLQKVRDYYTQYVLDKVSSNEAISITHLHKLSENSIPIPATFLIEMAQSFSENDKLKVKVTSPYPFEPRIGREMDAFQQQAWQQLALNPDKPVSRFDIVGGHRVVKVALPERLTAPSCVSCHNSHQDSLKKDWRLGDVRGIVEITVDVESSLERANNVSVGMIIVTFACLLALVVFNLRLAKRIVNPLSKLTSAFTALSERRFVSAQAKECDYKEVKELSSAFENFQNNELKRQALEEEVHKLAYFDALTGLPNRASMVKVLRERIPLLTDKTCLTLIIVKLEKLNEINDTLGYSVGDKALIEVAHLIQECCGQIFLSRFNTTEFAIAYNNENQALAQRIFAHLQSPIEVDSHQLNLSVSIGMTYIKDSSIATDDAIAQANIALYHAEQSLSEKLVTYAPSLSLDLHQRVTMIKDLKQAIVHRELVPYFQPQFDLRTNELIGAEVLLRWIKADGSLVPPFSFIPVAEKSHLIIPIGRFVLNEACRLNKQWQDQGFKPFRIAVNVSGVQFDEDDMVNAVKEALADSGLESKWLELEVTETALVSDINDIVEKLNSLRELGIELAIDDFGTGYSSLSYLKRLPIDRLKVDQSFVRNLVNNEDDQAIFKMILNLGKVMNLKVLAEGVEDEKAMHLLTSLHCDEAQGYHYAKPIPAEEFTAYLASLTRPV